MWSGLYATPPPGSIAALILIAQDPVAPQPDTYPESRSDISGGGRASALLATSTPPDRPLATRLQRDVIGETLVRASFIASRPWPRPPRVMQRTRTTPEPSTPEFS